jgi:hypothetical protein
MTRGDAALRDLPGLDKNLVRAAAVRREGLQKQQYLFALCEGVHDDLGPQVGAVCLLRIGRWLLQRQPDQSAGSLAQRNRVLAGVASE